MSFLREFASSNLLYWRQPKVTYAHLAVLLSSNSVLLVLAKSARFSFADLSVGIIMSLFVIFLQYLTSIAAALKPGRKNISLDAPKLAKSVAITWLISLILFVPNAIPLLRWFGVLGSYWLAAFLHCAAAVLILGFYSYWQLHDDNGQLPQESNLKLKFVVLGSLNLIITTVLFNVFVLDESTHFWILENYDKLLELVALDTDGA